LTITSPWRLCYLQIVEVSEVCSGTWLSGDMDHKTGEEVLNGKI